ncbi:unnamed protein product [Chironomus riparius]|uniref:PXA domain-containing protein n=1 Tax=Chironomus riparius TaxID=315576 RepID=A0A9N9RJR9_9DIPT|nr:unnamed protein product [Chironomus riparius]
MESLEQLKTIFNDNLALKTLIIAVTICLITFLYSIFMGLYLIVAFIISLSLILYIVQSPSIKKQFQDIILKLLKINQNARDPGDSGNNAKIIIAKDLDATLENFFNRLLNQFITSWYSNISNDRSFLCNIKFEIAHAVRNLAIRCKDIDYSMVITTKLLPVVYTHINEIKHSIKAGSITEQVKSYVADSHQVHPATTSRKAEIKYLRALSETLIPYLFSTSNLNCKSSFVIVRELFANWIFLPITDIIAEPDIINMLVILATNSKTSPIKELNDKTEVELLGNFSKLIESDESNSEQRMDGNFFNDQEKLYNFMQFLKSKNCKDVEILKFVLDVEHMNAELDKRSVICDPIKLSNLQQMSEKLLLLYRDNLFDGDEGTMPKDLIQCYRHARKYLEYKWKYDFYKSAEYYKYIYGDREQFNTYKPDTEDVAGSSDISSQKLAVRIKNAMSMKIAVDGIEEGDIQVFDALDIVNPISPFNSMAVRLRKEKGQDLDNFMKTFYHSIESEADMGEDIVKTQTKHERQRSRIKFGNIELYQNLFNITGQSTVAPITISSFIKTPTQSFLYFLAEIIKFNDIILRIATGFLNFLPNSDMLICLSIRKIAEKLINQAILAHLIKELEEKIFDQKSKQQSSIKELIGRKNLAMERLDKIKDGLSNNLVLLQNPVFNKNLAYCLLDTIIIEAFSELDPNTLPKS